jgi:hypothetical protein
LRLRLLPFLALAFAFAPTAQAAEVQFDGYYRARFRAFDSLSIDHDLAGSEGFSAWATHRLWLRPKFILDEHLSVIAEVRGLDGVSWGDEPGVQTDLTSSENDQQVPIELTDDLQPPTTDSEGSVGLGNIALWRVWAEANTPWGQFAFGRMPLHWGAGVWQNDGLGSGSDYGDTADRVRWQGTFDDVFVEAAIDANAEGFLNAEDDTVSYNASAGYRSETVTAGLLGQLRRTPARNLNIFTVDGAAQAQLGTLDARIEVVGQFGRGDFANGLNDISIAGAGGVLDLRLQTPKINLGVLAGAATGDKDPTDTKYHEFAFDRDYGVGLMMFEQPMPRLAASAGNLEANGVDNSEVLSGDRVANAMFLKPSVGRRVIDGLDVNASVLLARTMAVPDLQTDRKSYGVEVDAGAHYQAWDHLDLSGTFGVFLPGSYYRNFRSEENTTGYSGTVFAGQVVGQVSF